VVAWRGSSEHKRAKPQDSGEHARRLNGTMTIFQCMLWLALPACGSLLLLATTNVISQEIAVVPFLWVLPLALYLLTFVIAFDSPRWYARTIFGPLLIAALAAVVWVMTPAMHHDTPSIVTQIAIYTAAMFVCCMVCHGEVARLKPDPRQLTSFYLCIAAGGAIGGFLVAVVAPMLLRGYHELHIGLFACPLLFMTVLFFDPVSRFHRGGERIGWYAMILGMIVLGLALQANANLQLQGTITLTRQRSFYGVLSVYEQRDVRGLPDSRLLHHGAITHGEQLLASGMQDHPTTYYGRESGVGQLLRLHADEPHPPRRIGAVGLGVGTIALYLQAGDLLRFYEIDPNVERLARQYFTFLDQAQGAVEIAMGDARLSMEREADQRYDLLVLDAFSGDAIPVHLLTREAFDVYLRHLEPGGIIAIHITNQHLDLVPVVARLAAAVEMPAVTVTYQGTPVRGEYESVWAILSRDTERLARLQGTVNVLSAGEDAPLWTDDFTSLFPLLK
jgi:spermidine synthase/FtsH-binding integral membrane protein